VHEIVRAAVERHLEIVGQGARTIDDRLVVAGEKAVRIVDLADPQRAEIVLEKLSCGLRGECTGRARLAAYLDQRRVDRPRVTRGPGAADNRPAAGKKCPIGGRMIVRRPAVDVSKGDRLEARIGKADRARRVRLAGELSYRRGSRTGFWRV
jgi:hypothetical protein